MVLGIWWSCWSLWHFSVGKEVEPGTYCDLTLYFLFHLKVTCLLNSWTCKHTYSFFSLCIFWCLLPMFSISHELNICCPFVHITPAPHDAWVIYAANHIYVLLCIYTCLEGYGHLNRATQCTNATVPTVTYNYLVVDIMVVCPLLLWCLIVL